MRIVYTDITPTLGGREAVSCTIVSENVEMFFDCHWLKENFFQVLANDFC